MLGTSLFWAEAEWDVGFATVTYIGSYNDYKRKDDYFSYYYLSRDGEQIEIRHRATSRAHYADGSLRACRFLADKAHGLYDMRAVLGLSSGNPSA